MSLTCRIGLEGSEIGQFSRLFLIVAIVSSVAATPATATSLTPGNIIVSNSPFGDSDIFEYTKSGTFVQQIALDPARDARDLIVDGNGNIQVYDGTFSPVLTEYNTQTGTFVSRSIAGWSTVNNLTYGGIGAFGQYVFATDMSTAGDGSPQGVVRFDLNGSPTVRFAENLQPIDLNVGLDGKLYTLSRGTAFNGGGNRVDVFDPQTMLHLDTVTLPEEHRGIAIDRFGHIFTAQRDSISRVNHYDENGNFVDSIDDPGIGGFADIDLTPDGDVLVASHGGTVLLTTTDLDSITFFQTRSSNSYNFAAFVQPPPIPEPATLTLICVLAGCLSRRNPSRVR